MVFNWEDGFTIAVKTEYDAVVISANKEGLVSLAHHLIALSEDTSQGAHFHLDTYNSLEDGSQELIIEKIE